MTPSIGKTEKFSDSALSLVAARRLAALMVDVSVDEFARVLPFNFEGREGDECIWQIVNKSGIMNLYEEWLPHIKGRETLVSVCRMAYDIFHADKNLTGLDRVLMGVLAYRFDLIDEQELKILIDIWVETLLA